MKKKLLIGLLVITLTFSNTVTILAEGTVESDDVIESIYPENGDTFVENASEDFLETEDEGILPNDESTDINEVLIQSNQSSGDEYVSSDYTYTLKSDGNVTIIQYTGNDSDVIIPSVLDGHSVTAIAEDAFARSTIQSVTVPKTVTNISAGAFSRCDNLKRMVLEEGAESVPAHMAKSVTSLECVELPESVIKIGESAFYGCSNLKEINLPSNLQKIERSAFEKAGLISITFPSKVETLEIFSFEHCENLETVNFSDSIKKLDLQSFYGCNKIKDLRLPSNLEAIETWVFTSPYITELVIPKTLKNMDRAFSECKNLKKMTLEEGAESVPKNMANSVTSLESVELPESVIKIGMSAFYGCSNLKTIDLPSNLQEIGTGAFQKAGLISITFPPKMETVEFSSFRDCEDLETVNFSDGIKELVSYSFYGCNKIKDLSLPPNLEKMPKDVFTSPYITELVIPKTLERIELDAFVECKNLKKMILEEGAESVPTCMAYHVASLESVELPESVIEIEMLAFIGCSNLKTINWPSNLQTIGSYAFQKTGLESITIPSKVETLGDYSFSFCENLQTVNFSDSIKRLESYSFYGCNKIKDLRLPSNVKTIGDRVFTSPYITELVIPKTVKKIGDYTTAFGDCENLKKMTLEEGAERVPSFMAYCVASLESVEIPESVIEIGQYAFGGCDNLKAINLPERVIEIGEAAFCRCGNLKAINLPSNLQKIENNAFQETGLVSITIPSKVETLGILSFQGCVNLRTVNFSDGIKEMELYCFEDCTALENIYFEGNAPKISNDAFRGVTSMVYFPAGDATWTEDVKKDYGGTLTWEEWNVSTNGITLNQPELALNVGEEYQLIATVTPTGATNKEVAWKSQDESIVTVTDEGRVTAVAAGETLVRVSTVDGGFVAECRIAVNQKIADPSDSTEEFKPAAVTDLKAVPYGKNKVRLTWNPSSGAEGYLIYAQKNGKYGYVGMTTKGTAFTDTKALDTDYNYYWVFPYITNSAGKMIPGGTPKYVYAKGVIPAVLNLKSSSVKGGVKLTWTKRADATGYLIYGIRGDNGKYGYIGMTTKGTTFTDTKAYKTQYNFYWVFPYHTDSNGKMIVGGTPKYVYGRAK